MNKTEAPVVNRERLLDAWQKTLPTTLNESDRAEVLADAADPDVYRIHIDTAGHSGYSFDFKVTYLDSREIKVEFVDVEKDRVSVDEHTDIIQTLIEDYVRHIHECAQVLHKLTHG
ncbi:hypothetical protein MJA45_00095 [Paenibacillus aurantius]|uniref:Uncharacterized protein n=1 Tax=Paenibacillus aurantius TaxID=2918900 RepID=A0AA96LDV0_9BACL|nr:hypothetical protein [Paenibacillus aurantius]WJH36240.1 hypothetical protein N6H14_10505 [Paenibacillus sp. CC-CFT747]WNQ11520.1 hypothetical protein MJA45_00095 [Paenibacillus aurantius]